MPVDVGGMVLFGLLHVVLYVAGIVALIVAICKKRGKIGQFILFCVLLLFFLSPFLIWNHVMKSNEIEHEKMEKIRADGVAANVAAFSNYCKDRRRTIHHFTQDPSSEEGIFVRIDPKFTGPVTGFNAGQIANFFQTKGRFSWSLPDICARSSLRYIEGQYRGEYIPEQKGYQSIIRRYWLCEEREPEIRDGISAQYELVLGESSSKEQTPWSPEQTWLSKSSVQIQYLRNHDILAEDTMYFLRYDSGEGVCPEGLTQLTDLISDVFSH